MQKEIWKDVVGYEGYYKISSMGNVLSVERICKSPRGFRTVPERLLSKQSDKDGYLKVYLCSGEKDYCRSVHSLIAEAFLNHTRGKGLVVDHINNIPYDNRLENLQIISIRQNNSKDKKGYSSKYIGVSLKKGLKKSLKKWMSTISLDGVSNHLGYYETEEEAAKAYQLKLKQYNEQNNISPSNTK